MRHPRSSLTAILCAACLWTAACSPLQYQESEAALVLEDLVAAEGASRVGIVRYNPLWPSKAAKLGGQVAPEVAEATWMRRADYEQCVAVFKDAGLEIG